MIPALTNNVAPTYPPTMLRLLLPLIVSLSLVSSGEAAPAPPNALVKTLERYSRGIILIQCKDRKGEEIQLGSGFVIDDKGLAATCFHVLRGASSADAVFPDGSKVAVKGVRAWDDLGDIAIIELAEVPKKLTPLPLRQEAKRQVGEDVIAIGHPLGFKFTPSLGILSGVHTTAELPMPFRDLIGAPETNLWLQTSAALAGGNSGGPLLDQKGEVLGINTWVAGSGQKFGFASDVRHLAKLKSKLNPTAVPLAELTGPEEELREMAEEFGGNEIFGFFNRFKSNQPARPSPTQDYLPKVWEFARKHQGKPVESVALQLLWNMAGNPRCATNCGPAIQQAAARMLTAYADSPQHIATVYGLQHSRLPETADFLRRLGELTHDKRMRAAAWFALASSLAGEEKNLEKADEAIKWAERLQKELPEISYQGSKVAQVAEEMAFRLKHLIPGRKALSIVGMDENGKAVSLADHLGKSVLVTFWADRFPECHEHYERLRRLQALHLNRPFAIVGVNADDPARLNRLRKEDKVVWASCADGTKGPIAKAWHIESFPTMFLLDEKGAIQITEMENGKYESVIAESLKSLDGGAVQPGKDGSLVLDAGRARMHGIPRVVVKFGRAVIGNWTNPADGASWQVNFPKPGEYKVTAMHSAATVGTTSTLVLGVAGQRASLKVNRTEGWGDFKTVDVGTISVQAAGIAEARAFPTKDKNWKDINLCEFKLEFISPPGK